MTEEATFDIVKTNIRKLNTGWFDYDIETMEDFESTTENLIDKIK